MKKHTYLLMSYLTTSLLFFTVASFGQSTVISPYNAISENTSGDNITISSSSNLIGVQALRFNGTIASKAPVFSGNKLLTIGAGGYYNSSLSAYDRASIFFIATENWNDSGRGAKIMFSSTTNNTTSSVERMVIANDGNIGIGVEEPTTILHVRELKPVLQLESTGGFGYGSVIRSTSSEGVWENVLAPGSVPTASLVYWTNTTFGTTPLAISGEGDVYVERNTSVGGYTNLGATAPKIKMKELSLTTSVTSGGEVSIVHGLTQSKILSVSILVNAISGNDIPPGFPASAYSGYEYFFYVSPLYVFIHNATGNHTNIAGRPAKILITYKE